MKKVKAKIEKVKLVTGHIVYHATLPVMPMPVPLVYGEGITEKNALEDLNYRIKKDGFGNIIEAI